MSYFKYHVFICTNLREDGRQCCGQASAERIRAYAKSRVKQLGLSGRGGVRVNNAGCLDRCNEGPVMVIYPQETWYTYVDEQDIDEIIERHLLKGEAVERLLLG